jgi:diguanylate cyclase (GGDEF)-like protein/PAS domain S-box-containing protein
MSVPTGSLVQRYAAMVSAVGLTILAVLMLGSPLSGITGAASQFWLFLTFVWLGELLPVSVPTRREIKDVTTSTTFVFALLLSHGIAPAAVALATGSVAADLLRHKPVSRLAFNAGQYTLSVCAAGLVQMLLGPVRPGPQGLLVTVTAGLAFFAANHVLVGVAVALAQRLRVAEVLLDDLGFQLWTSAILLGMAPVVTVLATNDLILVPLLALPLAAVHLAAKGAVRADQRRAEAEQATKQAQAMAAEQARLVAAERALVQQVQQAETRFRSLVQNASDVILVVQADLTIRYHTPSISRLFGHDPQQLANANLTSLIHPDDRRRAATLYAEATRHPGVGPATEWRLRHRDGSWRQVEAICNNLLQDPTVNGMVLTIRDVTERHLLEGELKHQAFHDTLTGLANRALFRDRVEHALTRRPKTDQQLAVLFLDLDDFKLINDTLGHAAGDQLLVAVAERLTGCLRPADTAARLGGDEFAILLEDTEGPTDAAAVAKRILQALQAPFQLDGNEIAIQASIGVALNQGDTRDAEDLLRDADVAMYAAKAAGKGSYELFQPHLHAAVLARIQHKADLQAAIDAQQFSLRYQPIVDLQTGQMIGAEALVRWEHPERGLVSPIEFIPLAEETGLIVPLGQWVLQEACRQARHWQDAQHTSRPLRLSVNLSARQFERPDLVTDIAHMLQEHRLDPATLVFEITETMLMQDTDATDARLRNLKALGVQLAIDDFGTGYSSLGYLTRFPIDILKVDKSFVNGIGGNPEDAAVAHAILKLAQTLGLQTVAEGIERPDQWDILRALGCHYGQGYLFAKPLPANAILDRLRTQPTNTSGPTERNHVRVSSAAP